MQKITRLLFLLFILISTFSFGQKKTLQAKLTTENIVIDGKLDEAIWQTTPIALDFVMYQPDNGKPIPVSQKTDVKIVYNNDAIYVCAVLRDSEPTKIPKEITKRDVFGNSDIFGIFINGNNDGQGDFQFLVTSSGTQIDNTSTETVDDYSWDAVWESSAKITDIGWVVEMKIPYAALRFPKSEKQTWGINFYREIKRTNQQYTWNHINTKTQLFHTQFGILEGIEKINPPTRLFFIPYSSFYHEENLSGANNKFKAGLDIKYGISEAFTLDAILIPDFGQTKFDNSILNLSPFEQIYDENRPFFTEGTDLFNKGLLFYSRRIGQSSKNHPTLNTNEKVTIYPSSVDLINAVKVSGRTKGGLGIGVLNAVTKQTFETVRDTITGETRKVEIEPTANYSVIVLDQRFHKNSSASFVNTNVTRNGGYRDANVSAIVWDLNNTKNSYELFGDFKYSSVKDLVNHDGFKTTFGVNKTSGNFRFNNKFRYYSKDYDINDLGQNFNTNYFGDAPVLTYLITNPTKVFNLLTTNLISNFSFQNETKKLQDGLITYNVLSTIKNNDIFNFEFNYSPYRTFNFYQLRKYNRYAFTPQFFGSSIEYNTNPNHKLGIQVKPYFTKFKEDKRITYGTLIHPRYQISDHFSVNYLCEYEKQINNVGYLYYYDGTDFYYARRTNQFINNEFTAKYAINNKMALNLTARYYWSFTENHELLTLQNDGLYNSNSTLESDTKPFNENYNAWNMDLSYSWWFAPASQLSVLYRNNSVDDRYENIDKNIGNNFHNLFKNNLDDIISISLRYYIDYNVIKNKF
jgi:Domain of unknown function (DUF5916)/Carbohydrate family 9 binding domain-like